MYFARIRFDIRDSIYLANDEKRVELFRRGNAICVLSGYGESIKESNELVLEYGGFNSYEDAWCAGRNLLIELKLYCIERHISIKVSGGPGLIDTPDFRTDTGGFTKYAREKYNIPGSVQNDYLGLKIHEVVKSLSEITFVFSKANAGLLIHNFTLSGNNYIKHDAKPIMSLSLLSIANAINTDIRISFLLKIMAVEVLVSDKQKRDSATIEMINNLLLHVKAERLRSYLGGYKNKSIGEKSVEIISKYCGNESYQEQTAVKFWIRCYDLRSRFVHTGELDHDQVSKVDGSLARLVQEIIRNYLANNSL